MRQIAFFTADWNYELVGETLRGVEAYLQEHPDVRVRIFDCFGMDKDNIEDRYIYEIYGLADFSRYDGAIIQAHQIVLKDIPAELEKRVRESGIPALSIGTELGQLPQIRTDDYTAFRQIVSHLAEKHGARKLWFLQGLEQYDETGEAVQRRIGFRDACRDCGIPEENIRYLEGTWKAAAGEAEDDRLFGDAAGVAVPLPEMLHHFDGLRAAVHVGDLVVGQMEAGLYQGAVHRREGVEKLRAPDPGGAGQGLFGLHQDGTASVQREFTHGAAFIQGKQHEHTLLKQLIFCNKV